jgi:hypothetical protein
MKRLLAIAVAASFVALSVSSERSSAVPAPGPEKEKHAKWEYGILTTNRGYNWNGPEGEVTARSWKELAEKLKAAVTVEKPNDLVLHAAVLNHLGKQGWELVSHSDGVGEFPIRTTVFKRRILTDR